MLYEIDGKYYVLASRRYVQVEVSEDGNGGYDVKPIKNAEPIEYSDNMRTKAKRVLVSEVAKKNSKSKFKDE